MKTVAVILVILLVVVAAILILAAMKPATFRITRATSINASPEKIFPLIADFRAWSAWSPWEKMDPALKRTYGGSASGKGAVYEWGGNSKVGKGRMEIIDAPPPSRVAIKLDFLKPFEAHNTAEFTMLPQGDETRVTWRMHGPAPFMARIMHVFINIDKMVGKDFEVGLANLKRLAEK